jgi:3-oxoacyl-[acyl-carrier protein] reductase
MPTAVVTGASRGIGRAIARMLAADGYDLCLCARSEADLDALSGELWAGPDGIDIAQFTFDVTDAAQVGEAAGAIGEHAGAVDLLVVNAGIGAFGTIEDFDIATFDRLFAVNVRGAFLTLQAFAPALTAAAAGMVVVVSSDVSTRVFPGGGPYCATKHAVRALTRAYQQEHPQLRVLELRPGATDTNFGDTEEGDSGAGHLTAPEVAQALHGVLLLPHHVRPEELVVRSTGQPPEF